MTKDEYDKLPSDEIALAARTGVETDFNISQLRAITAETCGNQRVNRAL